MFEEAKWIAALDIKEWRHPSHIQPPPAPYVIRDFDVHQGVKSVILNVCGLGQAVYHLNGERIPDSIHPTHVSDYTKSFVYNTFDITALVKDGTNRFGAILGHVYITDPENSFRRGTPRMIAQIEIEYTSGKHETIVSDTSFLVHDSPTLFSLRRCGERYDANLEIPDWSNPKTQTDGWKRASICAGPGGTPRKKICPPKRIFEEIAGREIAPGLYDFGENLSGWVRLTLHEKNTAPIEIKYSEWLSEDKMHISEAGLQEVDGGEMRHKDVYIPAGREAECFEPIFTFHGFRYAEIVGAKNASVVAIKAHTDIENLAAFECDNEILNEIHKYCDRSILACAQGAILDCPQREQNEWTGDGMLTSEVVSMEYDSYDLFYEWMLNFRDSQFADGSLPSIVPCRSNWPFNFANGLDFSSAIIQIPYYAYKYSGNIGIVRLMWENMVRAMQYFKSRSDTHLMDFGVGDWVSVEPTCPIEITDTAYYRIDAQLMAEMAKELGEDPTPWEQLAAEIKKDFRAKYVKDGQLVERSFTTLICAVYSGMLEESEIQSHVDAAAKIAIKNGNAFLCGIHGLRMLFDIFGRYGYNDLIYQVLTNPNEVGYARSVADDITSLPEQFVYCSERNPGGVHESLNHHFKATVDGWFFRYVAGIRCEGFGWDTLVIAPQEVKEIKKFRASVRGVCVEKSNRTITVSSPLSFKLVLGTHSGYYQAGEYSFVLDK